MPRLHRYVGKDGYYVLTSIRKKISTFQLTEVGVKRLLDAGMEDGTGFRRAILFDLWRRGDAYTYGTDPGVIEPYAEGQIELDFSNDPHPDTIFPGCSICGSLDDLHLVEVRKKEGRHAGLYCATCRKKGSATIDTSIPLPLVTRAVLAKVLELKGISNLDKSASAYKDSLERAFNEKWDKLVEKKTQLRRGMQETLFDENGGQKKLI